MLGKALPLQQIATFKNHPKYHRRCKNWIAILMMCLVYL